ncbi:hypothetical protein [Anaerococcus tetradius]|uniref:hypothetical protein n=1 Tax=Anaerococcus tetradius TaxID=33036 RepID=UPI0023F317AB|nr:hypothetical protein [Anaerococcus tetradius]
MNKNKIGIAVLLLGLSLGPVQTSQNYTIRLNNLVYAEEEQGEDSAKKSEDVEKKEEQPVTDRAAQDNPPAQPLKETAPTTKVKETVKAEVEKFNSEVEASNVYKLATEKEKKAYKEAYDAIVKDIEKEVKEDGKAEDYSAEYKKALLKDSMELGYTVVKNIPNRIKLRNIKADLTQLEEAAKTAKVELPADLKTLAEKADKILAEKDHETDEIEENVKAFSDAIDKFKKDNKLTIKESKLSDEEAKYGYPDDVYTKGMGETKDLSEVRLDAKIFLEATNSDDAKIEKRLGDLDKKDSLTDKEKEEKKNLEAYKSSKSKLEDDLANLELPVKDLKSSLDAYVVATSKVIINDKPVIDPKKSDEDKKKFDEFAKRLKAIRDSHKDFIASDKFKKADEKLRKAYEDAYKALDGVSESSPDAESKIVAVEKAKRQIEKAEEDVLISKIATALNVDKNKEFTESENFRRAPKKLKEAYKKAFEDLGKNKTEENLKAFEEAKKAIEDKDFAGEFNDKLKALEKYIDQAKSDNLTEDSLKKLKKEYDDKLKDLKDNKDANVDDLKALEDDFNKDLNPEKPEKGSNKAKTTKRVVSTKKNAGGKVRTGVESVLPLAGGVLVVAAIALVLTRKKNK